MAALEGYRFHISKFMKKLTPEQIDTLREKAKKWDALAKRVDAFYVVDQEGELIDKEAGVLLDIGEVAAKAFGYR